MDLAELRKLVEDTRHLPGDVKVVTRDYKNKTYDEVRKLDVKDALSFHKVSNSFPLGRALHWDTINYEQFGYTSSNAFFAAGVKRVQVIVME